MVRRRLAVVTLSVCSFVGQAFATDRFVATNGTDAGTCTTAGVPCLTIGYAVAQALSGDTVKVTTGTYAGNLIFDASIALVISGAWDSAFTLQSPATRPTRVRGVLGSPLPGLRYSDVITVAAGSGETIDLTLDSLTISRGTRGIYAVADADAVVDLTVTSTILQQHQHGAIVVEANGTSAVDVSVTASQVLRNTDAALPHHGAGIRIEDASTTPLTVGLTNVTLDRNRMRSSSTDGAGLALTAASGSTLTVDVDGGVFTRNRAPHGRGGGIFGMADSAGQIDLSLSRSRLQGNRAFEGGGLYLERVALAMTNVIFLDNRVPFRPGGIGSVGWQVYGSATITNVTASGNRGPSGLVAWYGSGVDVRNSIFWGNVAGGFDDFGVGFGETADLRNNDIHNAAFYLPEFHDLGGNIDADPLLVDATTDGHLTSGSPCIDAGTCTGAPATDFDGDGRPTGGGCDIGADEFVP